MPAIRPGAIGKQGNTFSSRKWLSVSDETYLGRAGLYDQHMASRKTAVLKQLLADHQGIDTRGQVGLAVVGRSLQLGPAQTRDAPPRLVLHSVQGLRFCSATNEASVVNSTGDVPRCGSSWQRGRNRRERLVIQLRREPWSLQPGGLGPFASAEAAWIEAARSTQIRPDIAN